MILSPESLLNQLFDGVEEQSPVTPDENPRGTLELKLDQKSASAKEGETILLHKRPYDFQKRAGAPSCASIVSNETAYFRNQFEKLQFGQDLKYFNRNSEGLRLDSTKSCAVEMNHSFFYENSVEFDKTKDNSKHQEMTSDDSCFKVPRSIVRRPEITNSS